MTDYQIFDRALLKQRLRRATDQQSNHDFLHRFAAERLCDRVMDVKRDLPVVLQWGDILNTDIVQKKKIEYGVNILTTETKISPSLEGEDVAQRQVRGISACSGAESIASSSGVLRHPESILSARQGRREIVCEEEFLPFANASFDLVIANLNLQFVNDLPGALLQIRQSLKPGGMFLAALIGGQSLYELRDVLMQAELELSGGVSPRIAPMVDLRDAAGLLQRAGFALPVADSEVVQVSYRNLFHLMQDLRGMGWTNILEQRIKKFTSRALFLKAAELYQQKYPDPLNSDDIRTSFELIYLIGWNEKV